MVSALDFQSLILSSIPGGNRSFLLSLHSLRLSHRIINFSILIVVGPLVIDLFVRDGVQPSTSHCYDHTTVCACFETNR